MSGKQYHPRYAFIAGATLGIFLVAGGIYLRHLGIAEDGVAALPNQAGGFGPLEPEPGAASASLPEEAGQFRFQHEAFRHAEPTAGHPRDLERFYAGRAYPGAPPPIPHEVDDGLVPAQESCLACHSRGGFAKRFSAYAPVTPHPELENCTQCHVPQKTERLFRPSRWQSPEPPALGQSALAGSPPAIPHPLRMRENCAACHTGPGAVEELRTTHPERTHCRQCHVPLHETEAFPSLSNSSAFASGIRQPDAPAGGGRE